MIDQNQVNGAIKAAKLIASLSGLGQYVEAAGRVFAAGKDFYGFSLQQYNALAKVLTPEQITAVLNANDELMKAAEALDLRTPQ